MPSPACRCAGTGPCPYTECTGLPYRAGPGLGEVRTTASRRSDGPGESTFQIMYCCSTTSTNRPEIMSTRVISSPIRKTYARYRTSPITGSRYPIRPGNSENSLRRRGYKLTDGHCRRAGLRRPRFFFVSALFLIALFFTRRHTLPRFSIACFVFTLAVTGGGLLALHLLSYPGVEVNASGNRPAWRSIPLSGPSTS